jgi:hypothetical protein
MMPLAAFAAFAIVGQILNVLLCLALDEIFSPAVGALTFVLLYMLVFVAAYKLAMLIFDREPAPAQQPRLSHS